MKFDPRTTLAWLLVGGLMYGATAAAGGMVRHSDKLGHAQTPVFSKDGRHLAFEVNDFSGEIAMFEAQLQGPLAMKDAKKVALPGGSNPFGGSGQIVVNASWHPGGVVVFEGSNSGGKLRLYYHEPGTGPAAEMITSQEVSGNLTFPSISEDGSSMAFVADATGHGDIRIRNTNTSEIRQVTSSVHSEMFPLFTPDAQQLVFTRKEDGAEDVFMLDLATGVEKAVAGGPGDQTRPVLAGGGVLFFDSSRGDVWDLLFVEGPGAKPRVLGRGVDLPLRARPAVSPDGEWVAFAYSDPQEADQVIVARVDGSAAVAIPSEFKKCAETALGVQDGRTLLAYTALPFEGSAWRFLYVEDITETLKKATEGGSGG